MTFFVYSVSVSQVELNSIRPNIGLREFAIWEAVKRNPLLVLRQRQEISSGLEEYCMIRITCDGLMLTPL
jgi:hypothetical protein